MSEQEKGRSPSGARCSSLTDPPCLSVSSPGSPPGEVDGSRGSLRPGLHTPEWRVSVRNKPPATRQPFTHTLSVGTKNMRVTVLGWSCVTACQMISSKAKVWFNLITNKGKQIVDEKYKHGSMTCLNDWLADFQPTNSEPVDSIVLIFSRIYFLFLFCWIAALCISWFTLLAGGLFYGCTCKVNVFRGLKLIIH